MQHLISRALLVGMTASGALMLAGFVLYALQPSWHDTAIPAFSASLIHGSAGDVARNPFVYLYAGILVLMCTPIVRVCIGIIGFARERDWRYVVISAIVLTVIAISMALSIVH
jgi:uncharacterized membrane protein